MTSFKKKLLKMFFVDKKDLYLLVEINCLLNKK